MPKTAKRLLKNVAPMQYAKQPKITFIWLRSLFSFNALHYYKIVLITFSYKTKVGV